MAAHSLTTICKVNIAVYKPLSRYSTKNAEQ